MARAAGHEGEVVLRRRGDGPEAVDELIVNGAFAMDSAETSSERALATLPFAYTGARVLLGGLGLGYTAEALLQADVGAIDVVELESALVTWAEAGLTAVLGRVAADPRVRLHVGDVAAVLAGRDPGLGHAGEEWDAVLLDVDNGPDFLIQQRNAELYSVAGIRRAMARVAPGGLLAVWCQGPAPALRMALEQAGPTEEHHVEVERGRHRWSYVIYTGQRRG